MDPEHQNRDFQLWEYKVSHGQLLIRSPKDELHSKNLDLIFRGVQFISSPRHFRGIVLS